MIDAIEADHPSLSVIGRVPKGTAAGMEAAKRILDLRERQEFPVPETVSSTPSLPAIQLVDF
jgi:hypothetical protein